MSPATGMGAGRRGASFWMRSLMVFDLGRAAFKEGNFAQKKYKDAAAALYTVLAAGPGWNWDTMSSLYTKPDTYTKQLRELETYSKDNPKAAFANFLLAYQYLVLGSKHAAVQQLKRVAELQPKDKLSAALVKALTTGETAPADGPPKPGTGG